MHEIDVRYSAAMAQHAELLECGALSGAPTGFQQCCILCTSLLK